MTGEARPDSRTSTRPIGAPSYVVAPGTVPRMGFDWGEIAITVSPEISNAERCSGGIVTMHPGCGHDRHNHPGVEEVIFVVSGTGTQMVEAENGSPQFFEVGAGTTILVPASRFHSTVNSGSEAMTVFVLYVPGGAEDAMRQLPDFRPLPPAATS